MAHTEVVVSQMPNCDVCTTAVPAYADAKTKYGPWAYVCEAHFVELGCSLGSGHGQRLVTK